MWLRIFSYLGSSRVSSIVTTASVAIFFVVDRVGFFSWYVNLVFDGCGGFVSVFFYTLRAYLVGFLVLYAGAGLGQYGDEKRARCLWVRVLRGMSM